MLNIHDRTVILNQTIYRVLLVRKKKYLYDYALKELFHIVIFANSMRIFY